MIAGIVASRGVPAGAGPGSPDPLPTLPGEANIRYWFVAERDAYSDAGVTPAADGELVEQWGNQGLAEDAAQATAGLRPTFKTGGLNGKPYIQGGKGRHFARLLEGSHPGGLTSFNPFTAFAVFDAIPIGSTAMIFGAPAGTKARVYTNNLDPQQYAFFKSQTGANLPNSGGANVIGVRKDSGAAGGFARGTHASAMAGFTQNTNVTSTGATGMDFLRDGTAGYEFDGRLYEVIWYNTALSVANCQIVIDYLKDKYGVA